MTKSPRYERAGLKILTGAEKVTSLSEELAKEIFDVTKAVTKSWLVGYFGCREKDITAQDLRTVRRRMLFLWNQTVAGAIRIHTESDTKPHSKEETLQHLHATLGTPVEHDLMHAAFEYRRQREAGAKNGACTPRFLIETHEAHNEILHRDELRVQLFPDSHGQSSSFIDLIDANPNATFEEIFDTYENTVLFFQKPTIRHMSDAQQYENDRMHTEVSEKIRATRDADTYACAGRIFYGHKKGDRTIFLKEFLRMTKGIS